MKPFTRWLVLMGLGWLSLQLFFLAHIACMAWLDPESSSFQRSEAWRLVHTKDSLRWQQDWVAYDKISDTLKRAVIASEDDIFAQHDGVQWDAIEKAWEKNTKAEQQANKLKRKAPPKVVGGSTITQQLAKNLFLSGERTLLRKGQEFVLTLMLEALLDKKRILEIYLNNVEWGEGVFGAQAASLHYFGKPAAQLNSWEAARLAVMLPRPKYFEKLPRSDYLLNRTDTIVARMGNAQLP
jgi:monofunctional glycosyltransferase